ncbi:hypothetical protein Tco_0874363 [Tanacetum coccineum]|uniref:Transposase (putative) gypsy type domain-containing protein n=1 Tax=Tanacetum coccineum TaxID=301880 RepID=A0ABQ5BPD4_9ASTR
MSAKDYIAIQTCKLTQEEFNDFLALSPIPPEYDVMLPKSNQTIFDAPSGYVELYTHSFSLSNLRLPLTKFFCEVLQYFQIHISRLNPFGYAKLTTFVVMCKAYGCEPSVELFRGFFNLCRGGKWFTFAKRPEKHISQLFPRVITRIEGWKGRFFFVQSSIIPAEYPQLLLEHNRRDSKSYKDKLPSNIEKNPMFQRLEMAFRDFICAENEEDLSFLPKEPSPGLGTGLPSMSVNTKPPSVDVEPSLKLSEDTTNSGGSPKPEVFVVHPGSVAARIKDRKCKTREGSSRPPMKRKLAPGSSSSFATRSKASSSKDDTPFLAVSDDDEGLPDVIEKIRRECDVMEERERAWEEECKELRSKCEAAMTNFEKNPCVVSLSALESKVASLEAEKARLEAVEASLKKEVDDVKLKGYCPSYKKEHTQAGNDLATATFSWLLEFVSDPSAPIKVLLSKKPPTLQRPVPSKTQVLVPSSQRAIPSSAPASNLMSPHAAISSVKPQSSQS